MNSRKMRIILYMRKIKDWPYFWPVLFFVLAVLLRLIYFFEIKDDPLFKIPILDAAYYNNWARDLIGGKEFTTTAFFVEPGYAYILALFYKFFATNIPVVIFQFIFSGLTAVLVYFLGKKLFNPEAGIIAGFLTLLMRPLLFYDALLLKTTFEVFLITLVLFIAYYAWRGQKIWLYILLGLTIGITAVIKANLFYSIPFLMLAIIFAGLKSKKFLYSILLALVFAFSALIPVLPVTYFNWQKSHSFVLINYSGGPNIYIGNWYGSDGSLKPPEFIGMSPESEETTWNKMTKAYLGENITPARVSSYWTGRAWKESMADFGFFIKNTFKKVLLLFHSLPLDDNYSIDYGLERFPVLKFLLPFWITALLGITGMVISFTDKEKRKKLLWLYLFLGGYALTLVAAHVAERYRLALLPIWAVFAGFAVSWSIEKLKSRKFGKIGAVGGLSVFLLILAFISLGQISRTTKADTWNNLGSEALDQGLNGSADYFKAAIDAEPRLPMPYNSLGKISLEAGNTDEAIRYFRTGLKLQYDGPSDYLKIALEAKKNKTGLSEIKKQLADLKNKKPEEIYDLNYIEAMKLLREQKYEDAIPLLEAAKEKYPNNGQILTNIGMAFKNIDQLNKAKENLAAAILANGYNLPARYNMVNLLRKRRENELAVTQLSIINNLVPGYMLSQLQLAELQLAAGNSIVARELYKAFLEDEINTKLYPDQVYKAYMMYNQLSGGKVKP